MKKLTVGSLMTATFVTAVLLIISSMQLAQAKGASSSGGRSSFSSSRSYSSPSVTRSYSSSKPKSKAKTSFFSSGNKRDDDVECSDLRNSRHSADREVYRRYCL